MATLENMLLPQIINFLTMHRYGAKTLPVIYYLLVAYLGSYRHILRCIKNGKQSITSSTLQGLRNPGVGDRRATASPPKKKGFQAQGPLAVAPSKICSFRRPYNVINSKNPFSWVESSENKTIIFLLFGNLKIHTFNGNVTFLLS